MIIENIIPSISIGEELVKKNVFGDYNENDQTSSLRFTFVKKVGNKYVEQMDLMACRDMVCGVLICHLLNVPLQENNGLDTAGELDLNNPMMSIYLCDEDKISFENNIDVLYAIEDLMGIKRTTILRIPDDDDRFLLIISESWLRSVLLLSWYTLVLRAITELPFKGESDPIDRLLKMNTIGSYDKDTLKEIQVRIDLRKFMSNWRDILGRHPISGEDDPELKRRVKNHEKEKEKDGTSYFAKLHDSATNFATERGILTFSQDTATDVSYMSSPAWVKRYLKIK